MDGGAEPIEDPREREAVRARGRRVHRKAVLAAAAATLAALLLP